MPFHFSTFFDFIVKIICRFPDASGWENQFCRKNAVRRNPHSLMPVAGPLAGSNACEVFSCAAQCVRTTGKGKKKERSLSGLRFEPHAVVECSSGRMCAIATFPSSSSPFLQVCSAIFLPSFTYFTHHS